MMFGFVLDCLLKFLCNLQIRFPPYWAGNFLSNATKSHQKMLAHAIYPFGVPEQRKLPSRPF